MNSQDEKLLAILRIGHDTSMRGEGMSLSQALSRVGYVETRSQFGTQDLLPLIQTHLEFVEQWIMYSEDKRTSGGWYVTEVGNVGQIENPKSEMHFISMEEAVAEYVVRELDYWATV